MKAPIAAIAVAAIAALAAYIMLSRDASAASPGDQAPLTLEDLVQRAPPTSGVYKTKMERAKRLLAKDAGDVAAMADMAELLLESGGGSRPLSEEQLASGRELAGKLGKLAPGGAAAFRAQMALLLAEGQPEEALQPAAELLKQSPGSAAAHFSAAQAYLSATCSKACAARHHEQIAATAPEGTVFGKGGRDGEASNNRAAAMWRVMEAGRTLAAGAVAEPHNTRAQEAAEASRSLRELDAFRVSTSSELFSLGNCAVFEGRKLDGKRCPAPGEDPFKMRKQKQKKKKAAK